MLFRNIGKWVVGVLENVGCETQLIQKWGGEQEEDAPFNVLLKEVRSHELYAT